MEKTIKLLQSEEFGNIRVVRDEQGDLLFCGRDVAKALGYKKPENAIATHVDDEDKTSTLIQGSGSNYKSTSHLHQRVESLLPHPLYMVNRLRS